MGCHSPQGRPDCPLGLRRPHPAASRTSHRRPGASERDTSRSELGPTSLVTPCGGAGHARTGTQDALMAGVSQGHGPLCPPGAGPPESCPSGPAGLEPARVSGTFLVGGLQSLSRLSQPHGGGSWPPARARLSLGSHGLQPSSRNSEFGGTASQMPPPHLGPKCSTEDTWSTRGSLSFGDGGYGNVATTPEARCGIKTRSTTTTGLSRAPTGGQNNDPQVISAGPSFVMPAGRPEHGGRCRDVGRGLICWGHGASLRAV